MRFNTQKYRQLELFIKTLYGFRKCAQNVSDQSIQKVAENYGESGDDL